MNQPQLCLEQLAFCEVKNKVSFKGGKINMVTGDFASDQMTKN